METLFRTLVQITIITKVFASTFEDMMKSLPMPADLKDMIMDMHKKQPEYSVLPAGISDNTLMDFNTPTPFIARKSNKMMQPTRTVVTKVVTELNKPVTPSSKLSTIDPRYKCVLKPPPPLPPSKHQIPIPIPIPMQIPMYPSLPIILPMRSYFEPVKHDHPPLWKIKEMVEEDENKWKKENGNDKEVSVEVAYSDTSSEYSRDTDTGAETDYSDYIDVGTEYYDDVIKVNAGGRGIYK